MKMRTWKALEVNVDNSYLTKLTNVARTASIGLMFCLIPLAASAQDAGDVDRQYENAGRYAFLPNVFIDLERGWEYNRRRLSASRISLCSTAELNCFDGSTFHVVWPKACDFFDIGDRWEVEFSDGEERIVSEVVGTFIRRGRHSASHAYLLRTDGVNNFLYVLIPRYGLAGIVHDPEERGILPDKVVDEAFLAELASGISETSEGFIASYLVGGANVEVCNSIY